MNKFLIFFLLISGIATAQKLTITAKLVDKETKESLVFATVGILGKSLGTITNMQGDFDFHVPVEYRNDILVISIIGYQNYAAPVWTLLDNKTLIIELEKSTTVLQEVVVRESLSGGELLHIALSRIEQNYPMT